MYVFKIILTKLIKDHFGASYIPLNPIWTKQALQKIIKTFIYYYMTAELKEKIFSEENNESFNNIKKPIVNRPNIDNLIKRIINERKKQQKIHLFTVLVFLSVISASAMYYVNN